MNLPNLFTGDFSYFCALFLFDNLVTKISES